MALRRERMRLGDLLIKQNVLTEDELKKALELQKGSGKKIGEVLVDPADRCDNSEGSQRTG